ncbi:hypothetical protein BC832DRAFT_283511 [Gaertneriomyces semiglobifer]|nr:hypothetical protein BC832DRAFT_283511 [Gaertneriomyces semiglobifer]
MATEIQVMNVAETVLEREPESAQDDLKAVEDACAAVDSLITEYQLAVKRGEIPPEWISSACPIV